MMFLHLVFLFPTRSADGKASLMQISTPASRSLTEGLSIYRDACCSQEPKIRLSMPHQHPRGDLIFRSGGEFQSLVHGLILHGSS